MELNKRKKYIRLLHFQPNEDCWVASFGLQWTGQLMRWGWCCKTKTKLRQSKEALIKNIDSHFLSKVGSKLAIFEWINITLEIQFIMWKSPNIIWGHLQLLCVWRRRRWSILEYLLTENHLETSPKMSSVKTGGGKTPSGVWTRQIKKNRRTSTVFIHLE